MTLLLRRSLLATAALFAASWLSACSDAAVADADTTGSSSAESAAIGLETSNLFLAVSNNAGKPLVNVRLAIQPVGNAPPFTATVRRMENGEKREISLGDFRGNDGTNFSPRMFRARQVTATATDVVGKTYERTVPWKR
jgi:hypothetical protein